MLPDTYTSFWVSEDKNQFTRTICKRPIRELPNHDSLIRVHYSSLNYKDVLSISGNRGITKQYPHQPGIDASGVIIETNHPTLKPGNKVLCTGYDLGMNTFGGFGEYIRIPHQWVIPLPKTMSLETAMAYGTAGFTAALGLQLLEQNGQNPNQGPLVITGATGGVGCMAVAICSHAGYKVIATTGKKDTAEKWLTEIGATQVENRSFVDIDSSKALLSSKWAGAIDTVGGNTLHSLLKACKPYGNVACCGLVQSPKLDFTIYPFIINGINLLGIASAENPIDVKQYIWNKLNQDWAIPNLSAMYSVISLEELSHHVDLMMEGNIQGRIVVKHNV